MILIQAGKKYTNHISKFRYRLKLYSIIIAILFYVNTKQMVPFIKQNILISAITIIIFLTNGDHL